MDPELEAEVPAAESPEPPDANQAFEAPLPMPAPTVEEVEEVELGELGGAPAAMPAGADDLSLVLDVPVEVTVVMGRTSMTIRDTLALGTGSIITLDRLVGEPADLFANGRLIARGEVVAIDEEYGLRVTEVLATPHGVREAA
jgi:flagellar motor switch protein FliN/FliY